MTSEDNLYFYCDPCTNICKSKEYDIQFIIFYQIDSELDHIKIERKLFDHTCSIFKADKIPKCLRHWETSQFDVFI